MSVEESRRNYRNGIVPIVEGPNLTTLMVTVEQLESKSSILEDLDTKIAQSMTDPDGLENEVFKEVEIHNAFIILKEL